MRRGRKRVPDLYVMQQGGAFKIGKSVDAEKRYHTLKTGSSVPIYLLGVLPDKGNSHELEIHARFRRHQIEGDYVGSEWFAPHPELLVFLISHGILPRLTFSLMIGIFRSLLAGA